MLGALARRRACRVFPASRVAATAYQPGRPTNRERASGAASAGGKGTEGRVPLPPEAAAPGARAKSDRTGGAIRYPGGLEVPHDGSFGWLEARRRDGARVDRGVLLVG